MRKGISEIVATILIIGVVMAMGIMIVSWTTSTVTTETQSGECIRDTNFIVDETDFNFSGNDMFKRKITNYGKQAVYGFGVVMSSGNDSVEFEASDINQGGATEAAPLDKSKSVYLLIDMTNHTDMAMAATDMIITNEACQQFYKPSKI